MDKELIDDCFEIHTVGELIVFLNHFHEDLKVGGASWTPLTVMYVKHEDRLAFE